MSASSTPKKQCVTCNKSGGILTCDGCQQAFCGKHVIEHRQALGVQLDHLTEEYDGLQLELQQPSASSKCSLLKKIDQWEAKSIDQIRKAAATARTNLQVILQESTEKLKRTLTEMAQTFRSSREADDFSEVDLRQWSGQLKQLQTELSQPSAAQLVDEKNSLIRLKTVIRKEAESNGSGTNEKPPPTSENSTKKDVQERFLELLGPVTKGDGDYLIRHIGSTFEYAYARGRFMYSAGCHTVRFRIERGSKPYEIFFGCMSSSVSLKERAFDCLQSVGWFGFDQVYEHGHCATNCQKYQYKSNDIHENDELQMIIDCDKKQIRLFHERLKKTNQLSVSTSLAPLPWQFLIALFHPNDAVRIRTNP